MTTFDGEALVSIEGVDQAGMSDEALWIPYTRGAAGTYLYQFDSGELLRLSTSGPSTYPGVVTT